MNLTTVIDVKNRNQELRDSTLLLHISKYFGRNEDINLFERVCENDNRIDLISLDMTKGYVFVFKSFNGEDYLSLRNLIECEFNRFYGRNIREVFDDQERKMAGFFWEII